MLKSIKGERTDDLLVLVTERYKEDLEICQLKIQLEQLSQLSVHEPIETAHDLIKFLQSLTQTHGKLLPQIVKLAKIYLVLLATNSVSERSFSALKRVKTYLRSTMKQKRLDHLMMKHVHKSLTEDLSLIDCANDFVGRMENKRRCVWCVLCQRHAYEKEYMLFINSDRLE